MKMVFALLFAASAVAQVVAPQSIVTSREAAQFLVPVAGSVRGGGGAEYRTDLTIVNFDKTNQTVKLEWIPQSTDSTANISLAVGFFGFTTFEDVTTRLGRKGVGAILVTGVDEDGREDASARLDAHARIRASLNPNSPGVISLGVPPLRLEEWRNDSPAYIHGVRSGDRYRVNAGIVNFDRARSGQFKILVRSALGIVTREITLAPFTMTQFAFPDAPFGDLSIYVEPRAGAGNWRAYATATDNITQSGWYVSAMQPAADLVFPTP